ncbi:putative ribosomal protein P2 [Helianthus annuus]|nr:putative ribosomal protein P2 [Helianthus annuus]KAJ0876716.1 putative ribosomal protein L12 family [Helianthus annuus]
MGRSPHQSFVSQTYINTHINKIRVSIGLLKPSRLQPLQSVFFNRLQVVAAYLLALLGGNTSPSADDLKNILGSVGADADEDTIELLLKEVKGKDITELIASGREKLASVPSGGGGVAVAAATGGGAAPAAAAAETKKEEKVEEKEESDDDMGFSLFD